MELSGNVGHVIKIHTQLLTDLVPKCMFGQLNNLLL